MSRVLSLGENSSVLYAVFIVIALTAVNIVGLRASARTQNVMSVLEVLGLTVCCGCGFVAPQPQARRRGAVGRRHTCSLLVPHCCFVLFTYGGWNDAAYISPRSRWQRAIVKVLVISLLLITVLYLLFVAALLAGLDSKV